MHSPVMRAQATTHPNDVGEYFARRRHDWSFDMAYSDETPSDTDTCVALAANGAWLPILVRVHGQFVAGHHLHHRRYETGETLCSGFVDEVIRGTLWRDMRCQSWTLVRQEITRMGFRHIHCYAMRQNPPAQRWIEEVCGFTWVGIMLGAVRENGQPADIVCYTQREADVAMATARFTELFGPTWEQIGDEERMMRRGSPRVDDTETASPARVEPSRPGNN